MRLLRRQEDIKSVSRREETLFFHAAGRLAGRGEIRRNRSLSSSRQEFLREERGRGGKEGAFCKKLPPFPRAPFPPAKTLAGRMTRICSSVSLPCPPVSRQHEKKASPPVGKRFLYPLAVAANARRKTRVHFTSTYPTGSHRRKAATNPSPSILPNRAFSV